jgi:hypothetical protein
MSGANSSANDDHYLLGMMYQQVQGMQAQMNQICLAIQQMTNALSYLSSQVTSLEKQAAPRETPQPSAGVSAANISTDRFPLQRRTPVLSASVDDSRASTPPQERVHTPLEQKVVSPPKDPPQRSSSKKLDRVLEAASLREIPVGMQWEVKSSKPLTPQRRSNATLQSSVNLPPAFASQLNQHEEQTSVAIQTEAEPRSQRPQPKIVDRPRPKESKDDQTQVSFHPVTTVALQRTRSHQSQPSSRLDTSFEAHSDDGYISVESKQYLHSVGIL